MRYWNGILGLEIFEVVCKKLVTVFKKIVAPDDIVFPKYDQSAFNWNIHIGYHYLGSFNVIPMPSIWSTISAFPI